MTVERELVGAPTEPPSRGGAILTVGFGTTVAMWAIGYLGRIPPAVTPPWLLLVAMLACLVAGGVVIGRRRLGLATATLAGATSAGLNLAVIGSVIGDRSGAAAGEGVAGVVPSALVWAPGSVVVSVLLVVIGALLGARRPARAAHEPFSTWRTRFLAVAVVATLLVIVAGGLVTSLEAGLAVPDWPNSFGSNMFLYPLSRMTGGIYYEHAHRLYGALVGFTTLTTAIMIWATDDRRSVRWLAAGAFLLVVAQGVLGGLRVTGSFTLSAEAADLAPNQTLAIVHGVTGQLFLGVMVLLLAMTTARWRTAPAPRAVVGGDVDRTLTAWTLAALVLQLALGAMFRHAPSLEPFPWTGMAHISFAVVIVLLGGAAGLRVVVRHRDEGLLRRAGMFLLVVLSLQFLLGFVALGAVMVWHDRPTPPAAEVLLATAHQANGALLLGGTIFLVAWTRRLVTGAAETETAAGPEALATS